MKLETWNLGLEIWGLGLFLATACHPYPGSKSQKDKDSPSIHPEIENSDSLTHTTNNVFIENGSAGAIEQRIIDAGLVNIHEIDSSITVDLRYSSTNNFMKTDVYGDIDKCYVQPDVALKLTGAQRILRERHPGYSFIIFDGVRPISVQRKMWKMLEMPATEKIKYVSNPDSGSLHNFGAAVDLSILDETGKELDMGTPFDYFGEMAYTVKEKELLQNGKLSKENVLNRKLLREIMNIAGFFNIQTEWWHFNSCTRAQAAQVYKVVE